MKYRISKKDKTISGSIQLPGSKSISNRVLMIEALAGFETEKENLSNSDDTIRLQQLLSHDGKILDAGDAGTAYRFLTTYLTISEGEWFLLGSKRMRQRPIADLVDALISLGANIRYLEKKGFPPLKIIGRRLQGGKLSIHSSVSSQFISALLLIAPRLELGLELKIKDDPVSASYIDMTLSVMKHFGIQFRKDGNRISMPNQKFLKRKIIVESDWSAASYFFEAVALAQSANLKLSTLFQNSMQGDAIVAHIMKSFGVNVLFGEGFIHLTKNPGNVQSHFDLKSFPDLAPAIMVTAAGLSTQVAFSGLDHLQYKESNREEALRTELLKTGIKLERRGEEIYLSGQLQNGSYDFASYGDHRMAMALSLLALKGDEVVLDSPEVVSKSYPDFWNHLSSLGFSIEKV